MKLEQHFDSDENDTRRVTHHDHMPEVLIVDDDPRIGDVLQQLLEDEGFVVDRGCDGCDALIQIERRKPDVVLADMKMPRLDGVSLLREINSRWEDINVILMSASESPVGLNVPFLQKPFNLEDVLHTIHNYPRYT